MEVDGASGVTFEGGIEEVGRVVQCGALGKRHLHDRLVGLAGADDAVMLPHRHAAPLPLLDDVRSAFLMMPRMRASISPRQSPSSAILASMCSEGELPSFASFAALFFTPVALFMAVVAPLTFARCAIWRHRVA